ncbi:tryptophan synthase beta subunit-like PLP-dependent enzyme [Colletotrichum cereale]|nr:tryptophan synthase beta subunit-like PLP-dependent enzyme [Colletotrichum cereale]
MAYERRAIYLDERTRPVHPVADASLAQAFHQKLPSFAKTPLVSLDDLAQELGVRAVYLKDESNRLGLPAFKILGASWGTYRAITTYLSLPADAPIGQVAKAAQQHSISLYAATEGNHGRAVAAMAKSLGVPAHIYIPSSVADEAVRRIASEGATVIVRDLHYDEADPGGLLIQDTAFEGYEQIPVWIVEGYPTLVLEAEQQVADEGLKPTLMVTPVGVGSLAHTVVSHCKSGGPDCAVLSVEPDTAPRLWASLRARKPVSVPRSRTIMEGLNCGTVSLTAFADLQAGIDASVTVSDFEAHQAVEYLEAKGVKSGHCGGATVAHFDDSRNLLSEDTVVVLLNTEGPRNYNPPLDLCSKTWSS